MTFFVVGYGVRSRPQHGEGVVVADARSAAGARALATEAAQTARGRTAA